MTHDEMLSTVIRLVLAALVGALIGLNRDLRGKPAGVRTHALVSLGTALMVLVVMPVGVDDPHRYDALSRVIQGVLTGIGFLGAGVILRDPGKHHVSGLTTAATIWLTALLGVACGAGVYMPVAVTFALAALVVIGGGSFERAVQRRLFPGMGDPPGRMGGDDDG